MPTTPLKELYNLYRYIKHLINQSEFDYDDIEFDKSLVEHTHNWLLQTRGKFMKFVIYQSPLQQNTLPTKTLSVSEKV